MITLHNLNSATYWATRCNRVTFKNSPWKVSCRGHCDEVYMASFDVDEIYFMIKEGLLTSLYKKDTKEFEVQLALGTLCTMCNSSGTPLILIPTMKAYRMCPEEAAYRRTQCKQI